MDYFHNGKGRGSIGNYLWKTYDDYTAQGQEVSPSVKMVPRNAVAHALLFDGISKGGARPRTCHA
jgi:hypothetical protein